MMVPHTSRGHGTPHITSSWYPTRHVIMVPHPLVIMVPHPLVIMVPHTSCHHGTPHVMSSWYPTRHVIMVPHTSCHHGTPHVMSSWYPTRHVIMAPHTSCHHGTPPIMSSWYPTPFPPTLMRLAPSAKRSVFHVSSLWLDAGVTLQIMATLAPVPVREGCSRQDTQIDTNIACQVCAWMEFSQHCC